MAECFSCKEIITSIHLLTVDGKHKMQIWKKIYTHLDQFEFEFDINQTNISFSPKLESARSAVLSNICLNDIFIIVRITTFCSSQINQKLKIYSLECLDFIFQFRFFAL